MTPGAKPATATRIGARYIAPPSMFSRRDAEGGFAHTLPPMTASDEHLQQALLTPATDASFHPGDRWVALIAYAGLAGLSLAWLLAQVLS